MSLAVKKRGKFSPLARIENDSEKKDIDFIIKLIWNFFVYKKWRNGLLQNLIYKVQK